jgi:glyoxylase-like metal-dependent hydrolase (beta-lactamase superfamily II)
MVNGRGLLQLFDTTSSTYTYLLFDRPHGAAALIDPVDTAAERDLREIERLGLKLAYVLETHVHADHVTSAALLRERTGAKIVVPARAGVDSADHALADGQELSFGEAPPIRAIETPGHTSSSNSYLWNGGVFTGDALFVDACGRTDFQGGDAGQLYDSVTRKLFTLPDQTLVYPAHDYRGQHVSTIGHEKTHNARLAHRTRDEFIALMGSLNLPMPKLIDVAVPANLRLGAPAPQK